MNIDEILNPSQDVLETIREQFPFRHREGETEESRWITAEIDCETLKQWEKGIINTSTAREQLSKNNGWNEVIGLKHFKILAASLGCFRGNVPALRRGETE